MTYATFRAAVEAAGLVAKECSDEHWQILGGVRPVNFYPEGRRGPCFYVNGAVRGCRGPKAGSLDAAIRAAREGVMHPLERDPPLGNGRKKRIKRELLTKDPHCHWCGAELVAATATIDHVIPRDQGGSNRLDNLVIACEPCNGQRGNKAVFPAEAPA